MAESLDLPIHPADRPVVVNSDGNRIVLDFPNLKAAFQLLKPWSGQAKRVELAERIHEALRLAGLSLEVKVQGKPVAELGSGEKRGLILRLLGIR
ncbi:MAG: hypothetical protein IRZ15_07080 [Bryobacteraceae bacterium]|nr:hypothetical protein [Bryobacteraceae bacterium]